MSSGFAESCLRRWLKQDQFDRRERDDGLTSAEREELRELRKRVRRLEQEKDNHNLKFKGYARPPWST